MVKGKRGRRQSIVNARLYVTPNSHVKAITTRFANEERNSRLQAALERKHSLGLGARGHSHSPVAASPSPVVVRRNAKKRSRSKTKVLQARSRSRDSMRTLAQRPKAMTDDWTHYFGLSDEKRSVFDDWVQANRDVEGQLPLTIKQMCVHVQVTFDGRMSRENMSLLLHFLDYEYYDPGSGYLESRRTLQSTQAHARHFLPLLELPESLP